VVDVGQDMTGSGLIASEGVTIGSVLSIVSVLSVQYSIHNANTSRTTTGVRLIAVNLYYRRASVTNLTLTDSRGASLSSFTCSQPFLSPVIATPAPFHPDSPKMDAIS